jgi:uncharacterized protein
MEHRSTRDRNVLRAGTAALCWALGAVALAGPAEDTGQAEQEFARGDLKAAFALWTHAAERGYAPAQARLGDILDKSEDDEDAVKWYRLAADQGNAAGLFGLGQMYAKGEGVARDWARAYELVLRAAGRDHVEAAVMLVGVYRNGGLGREPDPVQADAWEARLVQLVPGYQTEAARRAAAALQQGRRKGGK